MKRGSGYLLNVTIENLFTRLNALNAFWVSFQVCLPVGKCEIRFSDKAQGNCHNYQKLKDQLKDMT